jgi:hypothetical protein
MSRYAEGALMNTRTFNLQLLGCGVLCAFCSFSQADSQTAAVPREGGAYAAEVHLHLGRTTLGKAALALSKQTGLDVEAADYLSGHQMTVELAGISTHDALDAICEIGGWSWHNSGPRSVVIEKPSPPKLKAPTLVEVASAMQHSLTPDVRLFLGDGQEVLPTTRSQRIRAAAGDGAAGVILPRLAVKLHDLSLKLATRLIAMSVPKTVTLQQAADRKLTLTYSDCTAPEKEVLAGAMLVYELDRCASQNPLSYRLLENALSPYQIDPGSMRVTLNGDRLDFSTHIELTLDGRPANFEQHFGWYYVQPVQSGNPAPPPPQ